MAGTSAIHPGAVLGEGTRVGEFCVIEEGVQIGAQCEIGHHVVIRSGTVIGAGVRVDDHCVLGKWPLRAPNSILPETGNLPPTRIGDGCLLGSMATVYRGAELGRKVLVADQASVREKVTVGEFTIVGRGVVVENECVVGRYVKLETECYITAYSVIEDRVFVAPQVTTTNDNYVGRTEERKKHFKGVTIRKGGRIGAGSVILPGREIGADAQVAAGSVVSRDVPPAQVVMGVPARVVRPVKEEQLLKNQGWPD